MVKKLKLLSVALLLSACSTHLAHFDVRSANLDNPNHGVVIIGVDNDMGSSKIDLKGETYTQLDSTLIDPSKQYIITSLPAGNYRFDKIRLNDFYYIRLNSRDNRQDWSFDIQPGQINYVGTFRITRSGSRYLIRTVNYSSYALEFLEDKNPELLKKYPIRYAGAGNDAFFEAAKQLGEIRQ